MSCASQLGRRLAADEERAEGKKELGEILNSFDYNAFPIPEQFVVFDDTPVVEFGADVSDGGGFGRSGRECVELAL